MLNAVIFGIVIINHYGLSASRIGFVVEARTTKQPPLHTSKNLRLLFKGQHHYESNVFNENILIICSILRGGLKFGSL